MSDSHSVTFKRCLLVAAVAALVSAIWAGFLWQQLLVARSGGDPFCALGGGGCAALWDGAFANEIHAMTGLPVAAWGVAWGAVAALFSLWTWLRAEGGKSIEPAWSAVVWVAAAGAITVLVLLGASFLARTFCSNCVITYALVAGFSGAVFLASRLRPATDATKGGLYAVIATAVLFVALLVPGQSTPRAGSQLGGEAVAGARGGEVGLAIESLLQDIGPRGQQALSNAIAAYERAEQLPARASRVTIGSGRAPMHLTMFTDSGCGHCGQFHQGLEQMLSVLPPGRIDLEQRVFPLDRSCNPLVRGSGRPEVCLAARARLCLEGDPQAFAFAGWLHSDASPLSTDSIYSVAARLVPRGTLEACVDSEQTAGLLREDIDYASEAGLQGTPFILVNGKPASTYLPFLYVFAVTAGDLAHPALASLPEPVAEEPGHEGHAH